MKVLCVNAGSSSLKFQLYDMPAEISIISGYVEKIGAADSFYTIKYEGKKTETAKPIKDHAEAAKIMLEELVNYGAVKDLEEIRGVGHRVLHGGEKYAKSVIIDEQVLKDIKDLTKLGPLHHPGNIAGIKAIPANIKNKFVNTNGNVDILIKMGITCLIERSQSCFSSVSTRVITRYGIVFSTTRTRFTYSSTIKSYSRGYFLCSFSTKIPC